MSRYMRFTKQSFKSKSKRVLSLKAPSHSGGGGSGGGGDHHHDGGSGAGSPASQHGGDIDLAPSSSSDAARRVRSMRVVTSPFSRLSAGSAGSASGLQLPPAGHNDNDSSSSSGDEYNDSTGNYNNGGGAGFITAISTAVGSHKSPRVSTGGGSGGGSGGGGAAAAAGSGAAVGLARPRSSSNLQAFG